MKWKTNMPAVNLYSQNGYNKVREFQIAKDISMTEFEKIL
jgi:hypothetical protein